MFFQIVGDITYVAIIARGTSVRSRRALRKKYGPGRWRKCKGHARVRLIDGTIHNAEVHWYEAHGIGRKEVKVKKLLD